MLSDDSIRAEFQRLTEDDPHPFSRLQLIQLPSVAQLRAIPDGSECIIMSNGDDMMRGVMTELERDLFTRQAEESHGHLHALLIYVAPEADASTLTPGNSDGLETPEQIADAMVESFAPAIRGFMMARLSGDTSASAMELVKRLLSDTVKRARHGMARLPF